MKSMIKYVVFFASSLALLGTASAQFVVEPSLGYMVSGDVSSDTVGMETDADLSGMSLAVRASYKMDAFTVGLEYGMLLSGKFEDDTSKDDISGSRIGLVGGYWFNEKMRATLAYYLTYDHTVEGTGGDSDLEGGSGFGIGFGYNVWDKMLVNLEYHSMSGDELTSGGSTMNFDYDATAIYLTASYPWEF